jgi:hypothetical protein
MDSPFGRVALLDRSEVVCYETILLSFEHVVGGVGAAISRRLLEA